MLDLALPGKVKLDIGLSELRLWDKGHNPAMEVSRAGGGSQMALT